MQSFLPKQGFFLAGLLAACLVSTSLHAAVINTVYGVREGNVIVRDTGNDLVITILAQDNRLYQFYAKDIISVTSSAKSLLAKSTSLFETPDAAASALILVATGTEVEFIEKKKTSAKEKKQESQGISDENPGWANVKIGNRLEGWIPSDVLTDQVVFPQKQGESSDSSHPAPPQIPSATADLPVYVTPADNKSE